MADAALIPGDKSALLRRSIVSFTSFFTFFGVLMSTWTTLMDSITFKISSSFLCRLCFAVVIAYPPEISISLGSEPIIKG